MKAMRVYGLFLLLGVFLLDPAGAQPAAAPARVAAATRHPVWRVEGKSNVVYLAGSIHLLKRSDYPLPAPIEAAFTNSGIAVFETDLEQMESMETQMKLLAGSRLPEGQTLEDQLSPATYAKFTSRLNEAGLPAPIFESMRPIIALAALTLFELQKLGAEPEHGMDKHFFERARKDGKQIIPLETVDFQLSLLTDFSKEETELMVKTTLAELDQLKKQYTAMVVAWRTGDSASLAKLLNEGKREAPAIFKRLLTDRNQRWAPKIEELSRGNKNAIVIVGAGHLVGNEGVVELLRKKRLKVTQL